MTKTLIIVPMLALLAGCGQGTGGASGTSTSFSYAGRSLDIPSTGNVSASTNALPAMAAEPGMPAPSAANALIGAWVPASADREDCEAKLVFTPTQVTVFPTGGGNPQTDTVTYQTEGASTVYVTSTDRSEKEKVTVGAGGEIVNDDCTYKRETA